MQELLEIAALIPIAISKNCGNEIKKFLYVQ